MSGVIDVLYRIPGKKMLPLAVRQRVGRAIARVWGDHRNFLLKEIPKGGICAEIGVWKGEFSERILKVARPGQLHLIDPWVFQPGYPNRDYGGREAKNQSDMDMMYNQVDRRFGNRCEVTMHRGYSQDVAPVFPNNYFDWVYIDGDHSYEAVKLDLELYSPKVKPGGYITGDDYEWETVKRAVDEFVKTNTSVRRKLIKNHQYVLVRVGDQ